MDELLKLLAPYGPGAVLAGAMFWFYRQDRHDSGARHQRNTEALTRLLDADQKTREAHTAVLAELIVWLRAKNGR